MRYPRKLKKRCKLKVQRLRDRKLVRMKDLERRIKIEAAAAIIGSSNIWESVARAIGCAWRVVNEVKMIQARPIPKWQHLAKRRRPFVIGTDIKMHTDGIAFLPKGASVMSANETKIAMRQFYPDIGITKDEADEQIAKLKTRIDGLNHKEDNSEL